MGAAVPHDQAARHGPGPASGSSREERRRDLEAWLGVRFQPGNALRLLRNGDQIFPAMLAAIRSARRTIELCTFVYWEGDISEDFAEALAERARAGVQVRVLLDGVGSLRMPDRLVPRMEQAGVRVAIFRPPHTLRLWRIDHRTHRKILLCDGEVGFTGGVGIAGEWEGDARDPSEWRETHVELRGPALAGLAAGFLSNWVEAAADDTGAPTLVDQEQVGDSDVLVLRSTAAVAWSDVALLDHQLIESARERLRIVTPYFVPDERTLAKLTAAAGRGVRIQALIAGRHNDSRLSQWAGRRHYQALMDAGVELLHYERTMLHAKVITVDGEVAVLGSPNFNQRSMQKDDELLLVVDDPALCAALDEDFEADQAHAVALEADRWRRRPAWQRALERVAGLVASEV